MGIKRGVSIFTVIGNDIGKIAPADDPMYLGICLPLRKNEIRKNESL